VINPQALAEHNRTVWAFGGPTGPEKMCRKMAQTRFIACPFGQLDAISRRFSKKKKIWPMRVGCKPPSWLLILKIKIKSKKSKNRKKI